MGNEGPDFLYSFVLGSVAVHTTPLPPLFQEVENVQTSTDPFAVDLRRQLREVVPPEVQLLQVQVPDRLPAAAAASRPMLPDAGFEELQLWG